MLWQRTHAKNDVGVKLQRADLAFLDPIGHAVIRYIELFIALSTLTSGLSLVAAVISVWTMQVTTRDFGFKTGEKRMALMQRVAMAFIALFLVLNAMTPFITPDPPWLANLPLVIAIGLFMMAFGISSLRRERHNEKRAEKRSAQRREHAKTVAAARKPHRKEQK